MDDFDDGGVGLPDDLAAELPDLEVVDGEVEIDIEGTLMEPGGRTSGGARAGKSGRGPKAAARAPAARTKAKPAKKAAKKKAKPAKKAPKKTSKASKKAKRKAGQKK